MLIGRIEHDPKKTVSLHLPESTLGRLEQYKELYQQTFGEKVTNNDLVDLMLTNVMDRDREFRRFVKEEERKKKLEAKQQEGKQQQSGSENSPSTGQVEAGTHAEGQSHQREQRQV
ncbi:DUF2274 domain-containing protein [Vreelandella neptunia]|jgi:hypothetical protein|uniref:DUF2274 domain-containing protein n=1 Tax=Vreelandella neptunia TaxID=115551 RepID=UPI003159ED04